MLDNEYLAQYLIRDRLREAEARGALNAMVRQARRRAVSRDGARPRRSGRWRQASAAWFAQLALPKIWNRL